MKKILLFVFMLFFVVGCTVNVPINQEEKKIPVQEQIDEPVESQDGTAEQESLEPRVKEFKIKAFSFGFEPGTITVNKGDTVKLIVESTDVEHGIVIPQFNVNVKAKVGEIATAEFVADKTGAFPFNCNVFCGSGHSDMKGILIVK